MKKIASAWVKYNANTGNSYTSDCVVRSLCFALKKDYNQVRKELNQWRKSHGRDSYKQWDMFIGWLKATHRTAGIHVEYPISVQQFSEEHPSGVFVCLTESSKGTGSHLVTVLNGDIYDSWDSRSWVVTKAWQVMDVDTEVYDISIRDMHEEISEYINECLAMYEKKYDCIEKLYTNMNYSLNKYSYHYDLTLRYIKEEGLWLSGQRRSKGLELKINPRLSREENMDILKKRIKQRIYDWVYNAVYDFRTAHDANTASNWNPELPERMRADAARLPKWVWPYVVQADIGDGSFWNPDCRVTLTHMPGCDPELPERIQLIEDNLTEIKNVLNRFRNGEYVHEWMY